MKVFRTISGVSRRDQWENRIANENIRDDLKVNLVEEVAKKSRLTWYGHVDRMADFRLPKKKCIQILMDVEIEVGHIDVS